MLAAVFLRRKLNDCLLSNRYDVIFWCKLIRRQLGRRGLLERAISIITKWKNFMTKLSDSQGNCSRSTKILLTAALLSGLSFNAAAKPDEVPAESVQGCRLIGPVEGSSGYGKNNGWQRLARQAAVQRAGQLGASHVVWERFNPAGAFNGSVTGKAYHCGS
jgi:hypothetical protein